MVRPAPKRTARPAVAKRPATQGVSILNFFKKAEPVEESMFVGSGNAAAVVSTQYSQSDGAGGMAVDIDLFNEVSVSVKKRKLSADRPTTEMEDETMEARTRLSKSAGQQQTHRNPFVDDSDSDSDELTHPNSERTPSSTKREPGPGHDAEPTEDDHKESGADFDVLFKTVASDCGSENAGEQANGEGNSDDDAGLFGDERLFMQGEASGAEDENSTGIIESCPLCDMCLVGKSPSAANVHVNACLDASFRVSEDEPEPVEMAGESAVGMSAANQTTEPVLQAAARSSRPLSPVHVSAASLPSTDAAAASSAFAKLMTTSAEDAAWEEAAKAAKAAKPSERAGGRGLRGGGGKFSSSTSSSFGVHSDRSCPFYKIIPGFFISVDAFRYGAVPGCRAYFLSHFHSDHYVGLSAKWSHGPIYCSRVTGSLVKSRLGTAAEWVVELDFEETVNVPDTDGVRVTMIPANHCPGSSLFLFEKTFAGGGRGPASGKKTQRILHCGDFRACPAQVRHPLLRPETVDLLTGKTMHQTLDVCYLDTTYLNPRYAFPPQEDVISSCAELCATLDASLRKGHEAEWTRVIARRRSGREAQGCGSVRSFFIKEAKEAQRAEGAEACGESVVVVKQAMHGLAPLAPPTPPRPPAQTVPNALAVLGKAAANCGRERVLVVCGTYSIGKERICKAIAQALGTKIYASPDKMRVMAQLGDDELTALLTSRPAEAQVHMQMLMEMRAETLADYLALHRAHFSRIIGFRPSGWNYRPFAASTASAVTAQPAPAGAGAISATPAAPAASLQPGALPTTSLLHGTAWRSRYGVHDMVPQRGSSQEVLCFDVPYSEHSSFRELALFIMALRIQAIIPTVNVGSEQSRKRMKAWTDRWLADRRRGGVVDIVVDGEDTTRGCRQPRQLWDGKDGSGRFAHW